MTMTRRRTTPSSSSCCWCTSSSTTCTAWRRVHVLVMVLVLVAFAAWAMDRFRGSYGVIRIRPIVSEVRGEDESRNHHQDEDLGKVVVTTTTTSYRNAPGVDPSSLSPPASEESSTTTQQSSIAATDVANNGASTATTAAAVVIPRAFVEYTYEFPCYPPNPNDQLLRRAWQDQAPATQGLLYEKPNKCASTTLAGVNLRMARNGATRRRRRQQSSTDASFFNDTLCDVRWSHGRYQRGERYRYRNKSKSFLWSAVRDPTSRAVSWYHFKHLSLDGHEHNDTTFQQFLMRQHDHFYLSFLDTRPYNVPTWMDVVAETNFVLDEYDFIGITERLDESLVVLMLLLHVPMADILYHSSKVHNGLFARGPGAPCYYLQPSVVSDNMRAFFASDNWTNKIRSDVEFYRAVNQSLDLTIERLGRERVESELVRFRNAQALVRDRCQGKVRMPCNEPGGIAVPVNETDCLVGDVGCGMECLDTVATELDLWTVT